MINNILKKNKYSFIDLIELFKIQIPILQRDYVQGRSNETVEEIRVNFVEDLVEHISNETNKLLPLDFIYGYTDEEFGKYDREVSKNNIETLLDTIKNYASVEHFKLSYAISDTNVLDKNLFIPLDGQQRLTTLYLLHFYVALKIKPESLSKLSNRLSYKTRKSSDKFFEELLLNAKTINEALPIADAIADATWFLESWKKDPTVEGALVMLQAIENRFSTYSDVKDRLRISFENLFIHPKIYFDFLDMNNEGLTDDVYLKMNSTGKELSSYDNFKSWFVTKVDDLLKEDQSCTAEKQFENWKEKLDQEWYNLFWIEDPVHADLLFFNFVKSIFSFSIISLGDDDKIIKEKFEKLNSDSFITLKFFDDNNLISIENIKLLFCVLEELCDENNIRIKTISDIWSTTFSHDKNFKKSLITELGELSLLHKLYFLTSFLLLTYKPNFVLVEFRKWLRVFRNIIYNTRVDDFSRFIVPIKVLNDFIKKKDVLAIENERWIDFFDGKQVREEFEKLKFENENTITSFEELENHFYLYGQILFLIDWCVDENNNFEIEKFELYSSRFSELFSEEHLNNSEFVLQRVLLISGDMWMPDKGSNRWSFLKNTYNTARERDENWRTLFNRIDSELKELIEKNICKTEDLKSYIALNQNGITDWRKFILDDPSLVSKCGQRLINKDDKGNFIRLLDKTKLSGYHTELRTWVLYGQLKKEFNLSDEQIVYQYVESGEKDCKVKFVALEIYLYFQRSKHQFCFATFNEDTNNYEELHNFPKIDQNILTYINCFNLRLNH
ncbi:GmrSD restriction endonuclease domain-containing protein [Sphingobacterium cellulitidis]|uniref:GmrSD restriction endonuclease domain-containing protein n=1 Tax=Sphingobacterium cellulitidis TaxID=1768011 RepID=UPI003C7DAB83